MKKQNKNYFKLISSELSPEIEEYIKHLKYIEESINKMFIIPKNNFD